MTLLAAALAALAVTLAVNPSPASRLAGMMAPRETPVRARGRPSWLTSSWLAGVLAGLAVVHVIGGVQGLVVAAVVGIGIARWVSRLEPASEARRRQQEVADLPLALDLIVAAVGAGRPMSLVVGLVADAVGSPLADRFVAVLVQLEVGSDPVEVWRTVALDPVLAPLGRAFTRASRSGTSSTRSLTRAADDLRAAMRADALERARAVGVRTAAPLGACFLPAFLLVGVLPTVAATFASLDL